MTTSETESRKQRQRGLWAHNYSAQTSFVDDNTVYVMFMTNEVISSVGYLDSADVANSATIAVRVVNARLFPMPHGLLECLVAFAAHLVLLHGVR